MKINNGKRNSKKELRLLSPRNWIKMLKLHPKKSKNKRRRNKQMKVFWDLLTKDKPSNFLMKLKLFLLWLCSNWIIQLHSWKKKLRSLANLPKKKLLLSKLRLKSNSIIFMVFLMRKHLKKDSSKKKILIMIITKRQILRKLNKNLERKVKMRKLPTKLISPI